jgi:hypothetical protein
MVYEIDVRRASVIVQCLCQGGKLAVSVAGVGDAEQAIVKERAERGGLKFVNWHVIKPVDVPRSWGRMGARASG